MARGVGERPERSPGAILQSVDYPITRDELAEAAADLGAPVETIQFLKSLPEKEYRSAVEAERDFAEADARFGMGTSDVHHRGDIGKESTEPGSTRRT
jgi:hypothetical protein